RPPAGRSRPDLGAARGARRGSPRRRSPRRSRLGCRSRLRDRRRPRRAPPSAGGGLATLADLGGLAAAAAQVVQLRAAHVTAGDDLDVVDRGRVEREGPLDTDPEGHLADGEGLTHAGALAADHDALEHLDTAAVPLDDVHADLEGVTGAELRD